MIHREEIEWCDIWIEQAHEEQKPRLLMVGDSITRSYYPHVKEQLSQNSACARIATSNCVSDPTYFTELDVVLNQYEFSMIHFNNGLHGWDYDEDTYGAGLAKTFDKLIAHCGADRLIWGTTTPVWKDDNQSLDAKNDRVIRRNEIAASLTQDHGIMTNDLYTTVINRPTLFCPDGVHFLEAGQKVLANKVVQAVQANQTTQ